MQKPAGATPSTVTLDLHGKTQYQAKIALEAQLRRSRGVYRIHVVHGYHNGTALRDLVRQENEKRWAQQNAAFIEAYNQTVEAEGLPLEQWRSF